MTSQRRLEPRSQHEIALLGGALVLAAALRLYGLGRESLWNDELATLHLVDLGPWSAKFWQAVGNDVHPPAYLLMMSVWARVFGDGDVALRVPSALAGIGLCWAVYAFARRFLSPAIGVTASYLAAVSPFLIEYSQEARSFSLVCLLVTWIAQAWLELLAVDDAGWKRRAALAALATSGAWYTHYSGLIASCIMIALVFAYAVARRRVALRALGVAGAGAVALFAPWTPWFAGHMAKGGLTFLRPPALTAALSYPAQILPLYTWAAVVALSALRLSRAPSQANAIERQPPLPMSHVVAFLVAWAVLTLAAFYVKSHVSTPIFNARNLIVVAPALILLAATAISAGAPTTLQLGPALALVCATTLYVNIVEDRLYARQEKEQFREVTRAVMERFEHASDVTIVALTYANYYQLYLRRLGSGLTVSRAVSLSPRLVGAADAAWAAGVGRLLVLWGHIPLKSDDRRQLLSGHRLVEEQKFNGAGYLLLAAQPGGT